MHNFRSSVKSCFFFSLSNKHFCLLLRVRSSLFDANMEKYFRLVVVQSHYTTLGALVA